MKKQRSLILPVIFFSLGCIGLLYSAYISSSFGEENQANDFMFGGTGGVASAFLVPSLIMIGFSGYLLLKRIAQRRTK
jgi:hypothetical protein